MKYITITELEQNFDKYIDELVNNTNDYFVITKNGYPIAKLNPISKHDENRIGIAKGLWRDVSEEEFNDFDFTSLLN